MRKRLLTIGLLLSAMLVLGACDNKKEEKNTNYGSETEIKTEEETEEKSKEHPTIIDDRKDKYSAEEIELIEGLINSVKINDSESDLKENGDIDTEIVKKAIEIIKSKGEEDYLIYRDEDSAKGIVLNEETCYFISGKIDENRNFSWGDMVYDSSNESIKSWTHTSFDETHIYTMYIYYIDNDTSTVISFIGGNPADIHYEYIVNNICYSVSMSTYFTKDGFDYEKYSALTELDKKESEKYGKMIAKHLGSNTTIRVFIPEDIDEYSIMRYPKSDNYFSNMINGVIYETTEEVPDPLKDKVNSMSENDKMKYLNSIINNLCFDEITEENAREWNSRVYWDLGSPAIDELLMVLENMNNQSYEYNGTIIKAANNKLTNYTRKSIQLGNKVDEDNKNNDEVIIYRDNLQGNKRTYICINACGCFYWSEGSIDSVTKKPTGEWKTVFCMSPESSFYKDAMVWISGDVIDGVYNDSVEISVEANGRGVTDHFYLEKGRMPGLRNNNDGTVVLETVPAGSTVHFESRGYDEIFTPLFNNSFSIAIPGFEEEGKGLWYYY